MFPSIFGAKFWKILPIPRFLTFPPSQSFVFSQSPYFPHPCWSCPSPSPSSSFRNLRPRCSPSVNNMFHASVAIVVLFSLQSQATVYFHNNGTKNGWDKITIEHQGSVDQVTDVVYKGSSALMFTQIYDQSYNGRYHSEVRRMHGYQRGESLFYGFAFLIPRIWQFQQQSYNIAQFIGDFSDDGCNTGFIPNTMVWIIKAFKFVHFSMQGIPEIP